MRKEEQNIRVIHMIGRILTGALIALAVCVICLLFASLGVSGGWIGEGRMKQLAVIACVIGSMIGGLTAVRFCRKFLVGLAVGGCLFFFLLTIGYLWYGNIEMEQGGAAILIGCLCGGALAGLLGGKSGSKRKKGNRKRSARHGG